MKKHLLAALFLTSFSGIVEATPSPSKIDFLENGLIFSFTHSENWEHVDWQAGSYNPGSYIIEREPFIRNTCVLKTGKTYYGHGKGYAFLGLDMYLKYVGDFPKNSHSPDLFRVDLKVLNKDGRYHDSHRLFFSADDLPKRHIEYHDENGNWYGSRWGFLNASLKGARRRVDLNTHAIKFGIPDNGSVEINICQIGEGVSLDLRRLELVTTGKSLF